MKTLEQVEPRIDLFNAPASAGVATGDADFHFIITQPGSYYLSRNLSVTKPSGISVVTAGATLDLNGFQISRGSGTGGDGILVRVTAHRTTIKNGNVAGFANGINALEEVVNSSFQTARSGIVSQVSVSGCSANGFNTGAGWQLEGCTAYANSAVGIRAGGTSSISRCVATDNGSTGIFASVGSSLVDSTAASNGGSGFSSFTGTIISRCSARGNGSDGFHLVDGSNIVDSTAIGNTGNGISVSGVVGGLVRGNLVTRNGRSQGTEAAGIRVFNSDNRIEGNNCAQNGRGIHVTGTGNLILKNSASGNALNNYQIAADNRYGVIINLTAGGTAAANGDEAAGTLTTTTNPWANFAF
jgi:parallel beta-helix repeat protein